MFHRRLNVYLLVCIGLMLLPLIINARVIKTPQTSQQGAEAFADRIMERFYETLDFATVYKEFYVSGGLRNAEVEIIFNSFTNGGLGPYVSSRRKLQIDFAAKERAYLALANFRWLSSAAVITFDGDAAQLMEDAKQALVKYYEPLNNKSTWPILTSKQLDERITSRLNELASFYKHHVVQKNFRSETYRARSLKIKESQAPESEQDLKYLFASHGVSTDAKIYVARRERFFIYLIEEGGAFKMLSFTDRIRF